MTAAVASTAASGTFNALAFTGFSFLFRMLDKSGYLEEVKRHDKALEELSKAKQAWYQNEVAKKDEIQQLRREIADADKDFARTNKAFRDLRKIQTMEYQNKKFTREPHLYDFYTPSKKMKQYAVATTGVFSGVAGWGAYKYLV